MNNSTNVTTDARRLKKIRLLKREVAQVLGYPKSNDLIQQGYITADILEIGRYSSLDAYRYGRNYLDICVIDAILEKSRRTWEDVSLEFPHYFE